MRIHGKPFKIKFKKKITHKTHGYYFHYYKP